MSSRYRHILFDFDGTLADTAKLAAEEYERIRIQKFSALPPFSESGFDIIYSGPLKHSPRRWLSEDDSAAFFNLHSSAMRSRADEVALFGGMAGLLSSLPPNSCSIVTSAYSDAVESVLDKAGLRDRPWLFQIAGRELAQPKSEKISDVLTKLDLKSSQAVYVGDLESDILYCANVPIDIIGVGYGYHTGDYIRSCEPTHFCETLSELDAFLIKNFN